MVGRGVEVGVALDGVRPWPWWMGRPAVDSPVVDGGSQQAVRVERRSERRPVLVTRFRWIAGLWRQKRKHRATVSAIGPLPEKHKRGE